MPPGGVRHHFSNLLRDMGREWDFIESNKSSFACSRFLTNTPHAHGGRADKGVAAVLLFLLRLCLQTQPKAGPIPQVCRAQRRRRITRQCPRMAYGWGEKLFSERMCRHFREDYGIEDQSRPAITTHMVPEGTWDRRPREGSPQPICRKVFWKPRWMAPNTIGDLGRTATQDPFPSCTSTIAPRETQLIAESGTSPKPINPWFQAKLVHHQINWSTLRKEIAGVRLKNAFYNLNAPKGRPMGTQTAINSLIRKHLKLGSPPFCSRKASPKNL